MDWREVMKHTTVPVVGPKPRTTSGASAQTGPLASSIRDSPKAQELADLQAAANTSPKAAQLSQLAVLANTSVAQSGPTAVNAGSPPIQRNFKLLDGNRINHIVTAAKLNREDLDPDFIDGLWESEADKNGNVDAPTLFLRGMKVEQRYITGNPQDGLNKINLFAEVGAPDTVEAAYEVHDPIAAIGDNVTLYKLNEEAVPISAIFANIDELIEDQGFAERIKQQLAGNIEVGGETDDSTGTYGAIEFRFKSTTGNLYVTAALNQNFTVNPTLQQLLQRNPGVKLVEESQERIDAYKQLYAASDLPFVMARVGADFFYEANEQAGQFAEAYLAQYTGGNFDGKARVDLSQDNIDQDVPPPPAASPKTKSKTYTSRARRGSRGAGQAATMNGWSATDYANHLSQNQAGANWEWLHLQGARLQGPNSPNNLVAGTAQANTAMIPYERAIYRLTKTATDHNPVKVDWTASLLQSADGGNTHVGDQIRIAVSFPSGQPDARNGADPDVIKKVFPVTFNAVQGATYTKFDRDVVDMFSGKDFG